MAREIKGSLYKVELLSDSSKKCYTTCFVECENRTELYEYLSDRVIAGDDFYAMNEIWLDG